MSTDKLEVKNLNKIRFNARDFYIRGYKNKNTYLDEQKIGDGAFNNRVNSIEYIVKDLNRKSGPKGYYRIVIDHSHAIRNPLQRVFEYKSCTDTFMRRYFLILSELSEGQRNRNALTDMIYSFENNDSCKKNSQVRDMVQLMADAGLIYKKKANIFALCDTREIENLFANNFSCIFDMLDFFAETDPLSVIGSYIREKLYADGTVAEAETPFMYHYLFPTQCLDSEITYTLLRALHEKKDVCVTPFDKPEFNCTPVRLYVSRDSGREFIVYREPGKSELSNSRLDLIESVKLIKRTDSCDDIPDDKGFWIMPYEGKNEQVPVKCTISHVTDGIFRELQQETRFLSLERDGDTAKISIMTNEIRHTLAYLKKNTGSITVIECDEKEKKRWINDIDKSLKLYGVK